MKKFGNPEIAGGEGGGEGGLVERGGVLLERGVFKFVSSLFLKKSMFSLLLEFLSGKYLHLL